MEAVDTITTIAIISIVLVIILVTALVIYVSIDSSNSSTNRGIISRDTACDANVSELPDISSLKCCKVSDSVSSQRYIDTIGSTFYDMVTSTGEVFWQDVCSGFCPESFSASSQTCRTFSGGIDQENTAVFLRCKEQIEPVDCDGKAKPIARVGTVPYYGYSATSAGCPVKNRVNCR